MVKVAQFLLNSQPELAMHLNITCSLCRYFDDMKSAVCETVCNSLTEFFPCCNALELPAVHLNYRMKIQSNWNTKELFKVFWIVCLWQEGKDATTIIIDQNNCQIEMVEVCS